MYRRKTDDKLLQELLNRGYGVDERKKWRDRWRRNLEAKYNIERRRKINIDESDTDSSKVKSDSLFSADIDDEAQIRRRAEDVVNPITSRQRRRIDAYAYRKRYRVTGFYERFLSMFTLFFPGIPDQVSWNLIKFLVSGKGYKIDNPAGYCLIDNLDALCVSSRFLLGHYKQVRLSDASQSSAATRSKVENHLRKKDRFAYEFLKLFTGQDESLLRSLDYLRAKLASGKRVEVQALVRVVKHVYRWGILTDRLDPKRMDDLFRTVSDVNRAHSAGAEARMHIEVAVSRLQIAFSNLTEFQHQLFPVLLKILGTFFPEEELGRRENRLLVYDIVGITEENRFAHRQYEGWKRDKIRSDTEGTVEGIEEPDRDDSEDSEDLPSFSDKFGEILKILGRLFPGSKIEELTEWPHLLSYFDLRIFNKDITFPNGIRHVSRFDPMGQIMILHRVIDNMLSSIDAYGVDEVLKKDGEFKNNLSELLVEWQRIYPNLFDLYLKELEEYVRMTAPTEGGALRNVHLKKSLEENLGQIRNLAMRHYEVVLVGSDSQVRYSSVRLYKLVEELFDLMSELADKLDMDAIRRRDPAAVKFYNALTDRRIVDFEINEYKPTIKKLSSYLERRYGRRPISSISKKAQAAFFEILFEIVDLYYYLLNERESLYRGCEGKIFYAQDEERFIWSETSKTLEAAATSEPDRDLMLEHDYTIDSKTGLLSAEFWDDDFPEQFGDLRAEGFVSFLAMGIDGWADLHDTPPGDEILKDQILKEISAAILEESNSRAQRNVPMMAFRLRENEICIAVQDNCQAGAELAERLRKLQEEHIKAIPLDISSGGEDDENRGTLSLGVAQVEDCSDLGSALERVEKAFALAREYGNAVIVYQDGKLLNFENFARLLEESE